MIFAGCFWLDFTLQNNTCEEEGEILQRLRNALLGFQWSCISGWNRPCLSHSL